MDNWFQSKWFIRLLALAFAITLFIFVDVESNSSSSDSSIPSRTTQVQTLDDVPVEIRMDSEDYVVSGVPEYATVTVEGTPAVIMPTIFNRNFTVYVDLLGLEEGTHTVDLEHTVSSDIQVYIEPKTVEVTIEERANEAYPVTVEFLNKDQLPLGYEIDNYELDAQTVSITTSRRIMEQIGVVKIYVDVAGADGPIRNREVPINVYDTQGNELNVRMDRETVVISVDFDNPSKVVPIIVDTTGELPEGYSLESASATLDELEIFAVSETLEQIEEIFTERIDLAEIAESGTMEVALDLPEGVHAGEVTVVEVEVSLNETRIIQEVPIEAELEAEQTVTYLAPEEAEMELTLEGEEELLRELSVEDFRVIINLSDLESGEHSVPVTIEWNELEGVSITPEFEEVTVEIGS